VRDHEPSPRSAAFDAAVRVAIRQAHDPTGWSSRFSTSDVMQELAAETTERTVRRALKDAEALGWVDDRRDRWAPGDRAEQFEPVEPDA
jgi:hypothetical protein